MNINISAASLRRAADIKDQIETLNTELVGIFHNPTAVLDKWHPGTKKGAWTPERRAKFRRTMRLKRGK